MQSIKIESILKLLFLLLFLSWVFIYSINLSINIPTFHLDGAYQTASGLYRLNDGESIGKDFYPYLGVGPTYLLYPIFKIFGSTISSSLIASQAMTLLLCAFAVSFVFKVISKQNMYLSSMVVGAAFVVFSVVANRYISTETLTFATVPGNSLRPIRSIIPYLAIGIFIFLSQKIQNSKYKFASIGILTGFVLIWSNDFALPTALMLGLYALVNDFKKNNIEIVNYFIFIVTTAICWFCITYLITDGYFIDLLKYNFRDVAKDQWWYFGPYAEEYKVFNWREVIKPINMELWFLPYPLILIAFNFFLIFYFKKDEFLLINWIGLTLFLGGMLASIGGHIGGYFGGLYFWSFLVICSYFYLILKFFSFKNITRVQPTLMIFVVILFTFYTGYEFLNLYKNKTNAKNDSSRFFVQELGGYLDREWEDYVDLARKSKDKKIIEEYWGIWSAISKSRSNWPVDAAIHALGRTRDFAKNELSEAEVITSTRYSTSPQWQPWSVSHNYWFYDELFTKWMPYFISPTTIVWKKSELTKIINKNNASCLINEDNRTLTLIQTEAGFYKVEIYYDLIARNRSLLFIKNNMVFLIGDIFGYVSINPSDNKAVFPVYADGGQKIILDTRILGDKNHNFKINSCEVSKLPKMASDILPSPTPFNDNFYLNDETWSNGISLKWPGFIVPNHENFSKIYKTGRFIELPDNTTRQIINISKLGSYIYVFTDGDLVNPYLINSPLDLVPYGDARTKFQLLFDRFKNKVLKFLSY
jgi:hypothetical protein